MAIKISKYSHHFVITYFDIPDEQIILDYCQKLVSKQVTINYDGSVSSKVHKAFVERNNVPKQYRFHIGLWEDFQDLMRQNYIESEITDMPMYEPDEVDFKLNPVFKPTITKNLS